VTVLYSYENTSLLIPEMIKPRVHRIRIDSVGDLGGFISQLENGMAVIGNTERMHSKVFDSPEVIREKALALRRQAAAHERAFSALCHQRFSAEGPAQKSFHSKFILLSICDLPPEVPLENVAAFMAAGREFLSPIS
jgi:uroporphyrinogen-III decarboxylase